MNARRRGSGRGFGLALAVAMGVAALASLAPGSPATSSCAGAGSNHASLVIEHGDGTVVTRCVAFGTAQITGQQLLDMAGVAWSGQTFGGFGVAACAIDGEPAHYATCPGKDFYWAIFVSRAGGVWQFASAGISTLNLSGGDAEGFRYVPATGSAATPPSPAGICATAGGGASATSPGSATTAPSPGEAGAGATPAAPGGAGSPAATPAAVATPRGTAGAAGPQSPGTGGTPGDSGSVGGATDLAGPAGRSAGAAAQPGGQPGGQAGAAPAPAQGGGVDLGLFFAAIVGGALAGLALLRLLVARRRVR